MRTISASGASFWESKCQPELIACCALAFSIRFFTHFGSFLYSKNSHVRLSVTTHALRAVDRAGGIDNYILGTSDAKLNSTQAMAVKERLMKALGEQADSRVADVRDMLRRKSAVKQEES
jgi:ribosomal protein L28